MKKYIIGLFLLLVAASGLYARTLPIQPNEFLTQTFQFTFPCNNLDVVYQNTHSPAIGVEPPYYWKLKPWLSVPIKIVFVHLEWISGGPSRVQFMVGSNYSGDAMVFLDPTQTSNAWAYPVGTFKMFPAAADAGPSDYIDLHGACSGADGVAFVTFGYTY